MNYRNVVLSPESYVAVNATLIGSVSVGEHSSIFPGVVMRATDEDQIVIGRNTNIQDNAVLHVNEGAPCHVGDNVTVGHCAIVHACTIGNNVLVGMHSVIMDGAVIGDNCIIGAGAVVGMHKVIPDNSLVVGVPGKIVRGVTPEEAAHNLETTADYVEHAQGYVEAGLFRKGEDFNSSHPTVFVPRITQ